MKNIYLLLFLLANSFLFSSVILDSDNPQVVEKSGTLTLKLEVVQGFNGTQSAILKVRPFESLSFSSYDMKRGNQSNPVYTYTFTDLSKFGKGFEYYFVVLALDGTKITLPEYQPSVNPFKIEIEEKLDYEPALIRLSPDTKYISNENFVIAFSFYSLKNKLDKSSIKIILDGEDISEKSKIYSDMVVAKIKNPNKGIHVYYLKAKLKNGKQIKSKRYETVVESKQFRLPFELDTSIKLNHSGYTIKNDSNNKNHSQSNFRMRTKLEKSNFGLKSNIYLSSYQKPDRQNINRFMVDLYMSTFDLILGDYSPDMGDLVMYGKNIRGITGDFHFKNFKLKVASGTLKKAIDGKTTIDENGKEKYSAGTFKMKNLSALMQVGNENGFSWGLSFAKNKDVISSLDEKYYTVFDTVVTDSSTTIDTLYMVTPQDNFVVGSNVRLTLFQRRIDLGLEVAMSVYNPDIIGGALSEEEIKDQYKNVNLPIDPKDFESIYVYNLNSQPLKPGKSNMAYKFHFRSLFYKNYLNFTYSSIGSVYKSLSVSALEQDLQTFSVFDNFSFIKYFNLNFGLKSSKDNVEGSKEITNRITNYFVGASYHSPDLPSVSFLFQNTESNIQDSLRNGTIFFRMSTGYQFGNIPNFPTKLNISFSNFENSDKKSDLFSNTRKIIGFKTITYFEKLPLITTLKFDYGIEDNENKIEKEKITKKNNYTVILISNKFDLLESRLKPYFSISNKNFNGDDGKKNISAFRFGTAYKFYENTNLYTDFGYVNYHDSDNKDNDNSSFDWNFTISYKF